MRSRTSSLTGPFPSSSSLLSPSGSLTVRACLRWKTACLRSRRGRIGPFLRPGDVASLDGRKHPFQAHPSQTLLLASPSQEPSFPSDHAVAAFAIAIAALAVFSPGPNRRSPVVAAPSRLTDPLVAPVGKRSTPRKGCARSTRTGAVFRLSGGGGIRTLERPVTSNGFRDSYEIGNCRDFCGGAPVCAPARRQHCIRL
jgi:hypothetical protein